MKSLLSLIFLVSSVSAFAQMPPRYKIKASEMYRMLSAEINKSGPSAKLKKAIEGEWFRTYDRPQLYPGGCSAQSGYHTDMQEIRLTFDVPLKKAFSFTTRRDGVTYLDFYEHTNGYGHGGYAVEYVGNTVVTDAGNCIVTDFGPYKDVMMCAPYSAEEMCSWYSFFIKN